MLLSFVFLVLIICVYVRKKNFWDTIADGSVLFLVLLYVITEILSVFNKMTSFTVSICWFAIGICGCIYIYRNNAWKDCIKGLKDAIYKLINNKIVIVFLIIITGMVGLSLVSISSNWDSLTYHLSRIMHWIQNQSTSYYATNITRQIFSPPLSEYVMMHTILLTGNDMFVCAVQGGAYLISAILVYGIARKLNMPKNYRFLAVFLFLCMPPAIAQSVTTQNDLFTASILLMFFYYYLDFIYCAEIVNSKECVQLALRFSTTIFLGYLSKSNVLIIMFCMVLYLGINRLGKKDKFKYLILIACIGLLVISVGISPNIIRNISVYGKILPDSVADSVSIKTMDIRYLIINFYKNVSTYMLTAWIPGICDFYMLGLGIIGNVLNVNINEPTVFKSEFQLRSGMELYHHDGAPNFVVMLLLLIIFVLFVFRKCKKDTQVAGVFVSVLIGFVWTATMSRWSLWKGRYFLPVSAIFVILSCFYLSNIKLRKNIKEIILAVIIIFSIVDASYAFRYTVQRVAYGHKMVNGSKLGYFVGREYIKEDYDKIAAIVNKGEYRNIGIYISEGTYEYPLWYSINNIDRMEHVLVEDQDLKKIEDFDFKPECVIVIEKSQCKTGEEIEIHANEYICIWASDCGTYGVYEKI